jgi:hypothetical protein
MQKNASFKSKHEKQVASAGIGQQGVWVRNHRVQSHCCLVDCPEILHWAVIIGAWLLNWHQRSVPGRFAWSQDSIVLQSLEVMRYPSRALIRIGY